MAPQPDPELHDERMLSIAEAIAEGSPVAWAEEERHTSGEYVEILRGLRSIEDIVAAHRHVARAVSEASTEASPARATEPTTWAHLTIVEKIDGGAFGGVYRAHDNRLATDVALKLLWTRRATGALNAERILKEARLLAKVHHPNVVRVYGADETQQRVGLWMEFITGRTLENLLETQGLFGAREAALIGLDVCQAVAAVHHAGLLHGDIKARNVMREEGGRTVLMDFGASHDVTAHAVSEQVTGTPAYLAPEVLDGRPPSKAADIYAIGVLLFHLVTDRYPVYGHTWTGIVRAHARGERLRLRDARPDLPDEFVRVVEHAIADKPEDRYATAGAFEAALSRFVGPAADDEVVPRRRKRAAILASLAVLALVGVGSIFWVTQLMFNANRTVNTPPAQNATAPPSPSAGPLTTSYTVDAAFYKMTDRGRERLAPGGRVTPGDRLQFVYQATVPTHVYIVNEPEEGDAYLLFPLPGQRPANPLPPNQSIRLPAAMYWQVTSPGGHEHFLVFASPDRVEAFEQAFAGLPAPRLGEPTTSARLPASTAERLRGVGGLVPASPGTATGVRFASLFTTPLTADHETANGLWVRQLTVDNPAR